MKRSIRASKVLAVAIAALFAVFSNGCKPSQTNTKASLTLKLDGINDTSGIFLDELWAAYTPFDTARQTENGLFIFTKPIKKVSFFRLRLKDGQTVPLILGPNSRTYLSANAAQLKASLTITDNPETEAVMRSNEIAQGYQGDLQRISFTFADTTRAKPELAEKDSLLSLTDTLLKTRKESLLALLETHKLSLAALPILMQTAGNRTFFDPLTDRQLFTEIDNYMIRQYGYQPQVKRFHYQLDSALAAIDSIPGAKLGDKMPETLGKTIWKESLPISKFRGKPLLVFVWSSLDNASENEVPRIKELWETYNKKGLDVYMISTDSTESVWRHAIDQYRLSCFHVNDLLGKQSPLYTTLGISSIPATFVIDEQGTIVAKNIWGEQLETAIKKIVQK